MKRQVWRWVLGLSYIVLVAIIWIASSYVVQTVVDEGVSPFLVTYICNSLFMVYIPLVEIGRYLEDKHGSLMFWRKSQYTGLPDSRAIENAILIDDDEAGAQANVLNSDVVVKSDLEEEAILGQAAVPKDVSIKGLDAKGRWTRKRVAKVSLLMSPVWFLAQLTFNISLKYTTVTSNTILSSSSSLFTFLVALVFLREKFTWVKLISVLLCMGGTIIVSLGDSGAVSSVVAPKPVLGDILAVISSAFYAVYVTLIRWKIPDEDDKKQGSASMAQLLGFLGLFNFLIFLPIALALELTKLESFFSLTWKEFGLIVGKGLLDNVVSDYIWAKAVLLTSTTVATAGLQIQVPLAAIVDSVVGNAPHLLDYIGGAAILFGFAGINLPSTALPLPSTNQLTLELETGDSEKADL